MLYEVKIYDGGGNLLQTVSPQELENKSTENIRTMFSNRDREHIMSLEDDEQAVQMHSYHMA